MNSKEKNRKSKNTIVKDKNIMILGVFLILFFLVIFYYISFSRQVAYASYYEDLESTLKVSSAEPISMDNIISENKNQDIKEEVVVEETDLEYITTYQNNSSLPKGTIQVVQEGRNGKQKITLKKTYEKNKVIKEEQIGSIVTKASVNKIVEVGTGGQSSGYKIKVKDKVQVTSDRLSVYLEPDTNSQKVTTLTKGTEVQILQIQDNWYYILYGNTTGWISSDSVIHQNQMTTKEVQKSKNKSKATKVITNTKGGKITKPSFGMALNKKSGLSLDQFKKVLTDNKDVNGIFTKNAEYFYYIEQQYNVNGLFVAAVGIHESGWGTSKISKEKYNLFGYGAYDSSPYNSAYDFSDYSESIDLIARVFVKYYINPPGTKIYDGQTASGKYYSGNNLSSVNKKYATDSNWAESVYKHMNYLYNKLYK